MMIKEIRRRMEECFMTTINILITMMDNLSEKLQEIKLAGLNMVLMVLSTEHTHIYVCLRN